MFRLLETGKDGLQPRMGANLSLHGLLSRIAYAAMLRRSNYFGKMTNQLRAKADNLSKQ